MSIAVIKKKCLKHISNLYSDIQYYQNKKEGRDVKENMNKCIQCTQFDL